MHGADLIFFFINLFLFIPGLSGIVLAAFIYFRHKNKMFFSYVVILTAWTLELTAMLLFHFLKNVLIIDNKPLYALLNDINFFFLGLFVFLLPRIIYRYFNKPVNKLFSMLLICSLILTSIPISIFQVNGEILLLKMAEGLKIISIYFILYYSAFALKNFTKIILNEDIKKIFSFLFYLQIFFYPLLLLEGAYFFDGKFIFGISLSIFFYFLINLTWLFFVSRYLYFPELKFDESFTPMDNFVRIYNITKREKEITELIIQGCSYEEIAAKLFIAFETVKTHTGNIYRKAGVKSKMELAALINKCN